MNASPRRLKLLFVLSLLTLLALAGMAPGGHAGHGARPAGDAGETVGKTAGKAGKRLDEPVEEMQDQPKAARDRVDGTIRPGGRSVPMTEHADKTYGKDTGYP